CQQYNDLPYSF
nr:immunoglobulin light chain junction region [Macaca mulatta]MOX84478.1 immunoglobulin light chain junction region [Macaca mulatta]MOX84544.1 immunoglobulin light chain junction region [Macaca mulatta]MOX84547.1 immunoglobulin light chain junction region [Macaca mulatta]MOX84629.1 immunoglobulin light chain junction region [Macaca mulatta]